MSKSLTSKEQDKAIYNNGVRDALLEVFKYDGIIPDKDERVYLVNRVLEKISYAFPSQKPIK